MTYRGPRPQGWARSIQPNEIGTRGRCSDAVGEELPTRCRPRRRVLRPVRLRLCQSQSRIVVGITRNQSGFITMTVRESATSPVVRSVRLYTRVVWNVYQPRPSQDDTCTGMSRLSPGGRRWGLTVRKL